MNFKGEFRNCYILRQGNLSSCLINVGVLCCEFAPWNKSQENSSSLDSKFVLATGGNDDYVKIWTIGKSNF